MVLLNAAAQTQAILLVVAAVLAGLFALSRVLRQLLGEGWWRSRRTAARPEDEQEQP